MEKNLALSELNEIEQKLEVWIKSHQSFLGEFQDYNIAEDGKPQFHVRGYFNKGVHIPFEAITLDEYKDKEGKRLLEKEKSDIIYKVNFVEKLKKRLQLIREQRLKLFLGENFFTNEPGEPSLILDYNDSAKTIIETLKKDERYKTVKAYRFKSLLGKYCEQHYQDFYNKFEGISIKRNEFCAEIFPELDNKLKLSKNLPGWGANNLEDSMKHNSKR